MSKGFSSEGFDLDALNSDDKDGVIFEIGGGATVVPEPTETKDSEKGKDKGDLPIELVKAEEWKQRGNEEFKKGSYLEAYDMYTEAIEACPGLKGPEILRQRDEFDEAEREKAYSRHRVNNDGNESKPSTANEEKKEPEKPKPIPQFELPPQLHGSKLAVYYCNRAATSIHLGKFEEAVEDCDVAILLNVKYTKGYVRRSTALERLEKTEEALRDAKIALEMEPSNITLKRTVNRLQKLEDERLEKLKAETMDKLKDLGNSILGNFGLSLDNFQAVQDPATGSYSVSFNQS